MDCGAGAGQNRHAGAIHRKNCIFAVQEIGLPPATGLPRHGAISGSSHRQNRHHRRYGAEFCSRPHLCLGPAQLMRSQQPSKPPVRPLFLFQFNDSKADMSARARAIRLGCAVKPSSTLQCNADRVQRSKNQSHHTHGRPVRRNSGPVALQSCVKTVVFTGLQPIAAMKSLCRTVRRDGKNALINGRINRSEAGTSWP